MKTETKKNIWQMTLDEFTGKLVVSDVFAIDGRADEDYLILWSFASESEMLLPPVWRQGEYWISEIDGFEPEGTFVLFHSTDGSVGFHMDGQCWIDVEHRGRKLSIQLILASAARHGGRPFAREATHVGFSPAGYAALKAAYKHAVKQAMDSKLDVPKDVAQAVLPPRC